MSIITTTTRRPKWQYPPAQQTPRILHLPRRPRRKQPPPTKPTSIKAHHTGKLEALFDQERAFSRIGMPMVLLNSERRRERVEEENESGVIVEEEKWRFQAEMLRAECNLLRMEKEIAVKKLERRRAQMERVLRSAVQTLVSGRKKEGEILDLAEKLEKLRRRSGCKDIEVRKCSNFDKQASLLQKRLEKKFGGTSDENCVKEIQEMAEASLSINVSCTVDGSSVSNRKCNNVQVEILRRKMDGLSKGVLLERMKEEYGSMLSAANNSVASSASISKFTEFRDSTSSSIQLDQEEKVCSGHCKAIVERIVEQVRAETEQWTQMQEMLGQVREEMEELQASRDFWEDRALNSDYQIQCLNSAVQQWRQKAVSADSKRVELQGQLSVLHGELETLKTEGMRAKVSSPIPRDSANETEKRVLICRLKENHQTNDNGSKTREVFRDGRRKEYACSKGLVAPKRSPFRDIGNSQKNRSNLEQNLGGCRF